MRRSPPNRFDPYVDERGIPYDRFAGTIENLVDDVNGLSVPQPNEQTGSYTVVDGDLLIVRTGTNVQVEFTIPSGLEGCLEIHNNSTNTLKINAPTLRHVTLGTGQRTLSAWGTAFLRSTSADFWKITGEGIT